MSVMNNPPLNKENSYRSPLRIVAMMIKQRTTNPNHRSYKNYGARGIRMCEEWSNDYGKFEQYCLENGWQEGLQVHRIDNDGNYEPGNVAFITPQAHARLSSQIKLSVEKVREIKIMRAKGMTMQAIADHFGINNGHVCIILQGKRWADVEVDPELLKGHPEVNTRASRLTPEIVREIHKAIHFEGLGCKKLAKRFQLSSSMISHIRNGKIWNSIWQEFQHLNKPQAEEVAA